MADLERGVVEPKPDSDVTDSDSAIIDSGAATPAGSDPGATEPVDRPPNPAPITIVPAFEFVETSASARNLYVRHQLRGRGSVKWVCGRCGLGDEVGTAEPPTRCGAVVARLLVVYRTDGPGRKRERETDCGRAQ